MGEFGGEEKEEGNDVTIISKQKKKPHPNSQFY